MGNHVWPVIKNEKRVVKKRDESATLGDGDNQSHVVVGHGVNYSTG